MAGRGLALVLLLGGTEGALAARYDDAWSAAAEAAAEAAVARQAAPGRALVPTVRRVPGLVAGTAATIAKICFVVFLVLFLFSLLSGRRRL